MSVDFLPSESLVPIDPSVFEIIKKQYDLIPSVYNDVLREVGPKQRYFNDLRAGLAPVVGKLEEMDGRSPLIAYIDIFSCTAEPGQPFVSSWARTWHVDTPRDGANCEVAAVSTQPTETIHGTLDHPSLTDISVQAGIDFINRFTDKVLKEEYGLVISQGVANQASLYNKRTPHRAAINSLDVPVTRNLLFAGLVRSRARERSLDPAAATAPRT